MKIKDEASTEIVDINTGNLEKLATYGTQDEDKQNTSITQYVGHQYTQAQKNNVNKTGVKCPWCYKIVPCKPSKSYFYLIY
jgi:hypothetical protein